MTEQPIEDKRQLWARLKVAWARYKDAKVLDEREEMAKWARVVRETQRGLGVPISSFDVLKAEDKVAEEQG